MGTRGMNGMVLLVAIVIGASVVGCAMGLASRKEQAGFRYQKTTEVKVDDGSQSQVVEVHAAGDTSRASRVSDRLGITALAFGCCGCVGAVVCVVLLVRHHRSKVDDLVV